MKRKLLIILLILSCCCVSKNAKAQWVTIPDSNFVNWLNANGFSSCMNGNLMDTTCNAVLNATSIFCDNNNISDITGIKYFTNLQTLGCSYNNIALITDLPQKLKGFYCGSNSLTNLPALPNSLLDLQCMSNLLTYLPILPDSLSTLLFSNNQIANLPSLPDSLKNLDCSFNPLFNLPILPSGLRSLSCAYDSLSFLPILPTKLQFLTCTGNPIDSLPNLPLTLTHLNCEYCQLTSLPSLPSTLYTLYCSSNLITVLPALPLHLYGIYCSGNFLTTLPTLPTTLSILSCSSNQLTTLPNLHNGLFGLYCASNNIASITNFPDSMYSFDCSNNPNLTCLPELKKIQNFNFTNTAIQCLPNYGTVINSNPSLSTLPLCDLFNNNSCAAYWNISGKVYSDSHSNCISETSEQKLGNIKLMLYDSTGNLLQQTFTGGEGLYSFNTDTGTYTYTIDTTNLPILVSCPVAGYHTSMLIAIDSMDYNMDFAMQCKSGFDIGANAIVRDSGSFRPAHFAEIIIKAGDLTNKFGLHCASGISGIVTVIINGPASYSYAANGSLIPNVNGDTIIYSIADFGAINFNSDFTFIVQTDTTAIIGNTVCFDVYVTPNAGDIYPSNNSLQQCFDVVSSFDPNEKEVYPINRVEDSNGNLNYTIHFQNTGNAPAQHIYILDTLDVAIDESSFELLAYSFQPQMQIIGNVVKFNFPNINLLDSVNDEPNSHGYVQYRVKLKDSLVPGTLISNTSYIYFDFNAPVQTNAVVDTLTNCNNLAAIDIVNQTFCSGDTLMVNSSNPYATAFAWYVDSVLMSNNQNISIPNLSIGVHEIKLVASNSYCTNSETVSNIEIHNLPVVQLGNDTTYCGQYLLDAGTGNISYLWSNGATTQTIIANTSANYSVIVTDNNGCSNTDTVVVIINPLPIKPTIIQNISLLTSTSSTGNQWLMNGNVISGATSNTYTVTLTGWYNVQVTDVDGCANVSDSIVMDLTGVNDIANSKSNIQIIPNPATTSFEVSGLNFQVNDVVIISDAFGKIVQQLKMSQPTSNLNIPTSNYASGVYFVCIKTAKATYTLRLIKM